MIPSVHAELASYWATSASKSVSLWADSSYGPLEQGHIMGAAMDMRFPLRSFTSSFGGGLAVKGDFGDPAGNPADVVIIEMGYNDDCNMSSREAVNRMRQRKWYNILKSSASQVKFVLFVRQPSYRQTCPPKKKKKGAPQAWTYGAVVEGSKWTDEAVRLVSEELCMRAVCLDVPAEEQYGGMLTRDAAGVVWQCGGRSYTESGVDYTEDGELALWEDSLHPTVAGAKAHFRCLVAAFRARYESAATIIENVEDNRRERSRSRTR
eukprot:TRINITY_DN42585_c0_g1_i1.p1 TRINITY_DN42585_c0_g1~~TRINITY_DN42585_c0_g1_i1.p1  ORF type:complete len:265 (-),score=22.84 TRINITY_DN42585_c0_g1_i1:106-900(-)